MGDTIPSYTCVTTPFMRLAYPFGFFHSWMCVCASSGWKNVEMQSISPRLMRMSFSDSGVWSPPTSGVSPPGKTESISVSTGREASVLPEVVSPAVAMYRLSGWRMPPSFGRSPMSYRHADRITHLFARQYGLFRYGKVDSAQVR